jgi:hypothetical protein
MLDSCDPPDLLRRPKRKASTAGMSSILLPLIAHLFLNDPSNREVKERFNAFVPSDDNAGFSEQIGAFAEKMATYAGSVQGSSEYRKQVLARLCPAMLRYELGTRAAFDQAGFNGRALTDDVMDVMLTLASDKGLADGVMPDKERTRAEFPYVGEPYTKPGQAGVTPVPRPPEVNGWDYGIH